MYEFSLLRSSHHWIRVSVQVPNTHSRSECSVNFLTNVFIRSLCIYSFLYYFFMFKAIMVILLICCKWTRLNVCEIRVRTKYVITYVALNCCVQNIRIFRFSLQAYILIYIYIHIPWESRNLLFDVFECHFYIYTYIYIYRYILAKWSLHLLGGIYIFIYIYICFVNKICCWYQET